MTSLLFRNGHIVTPEGVLASACFSIEAGRIGAIDTSETSDAAIDLEGGWVLPGFVDTQVNGGGGVLFNDRPDLEGIRAIASVQTRFGTTSFLPTLISDELDKVEIALDAVDQAIAEAVPGVVGIHLEGPFLNRTRKGIHDDACFRRLDDAVIALLTRRRSGKVMLTLAPELCTPAQIAELVAADVIVSAGHSDADYHTVRAARSAGLTGFTHLFNAMSPFQHRDPGMVGAALEDPDAWCGLIADGFHVHPAALRIAVRSRPANRTMLVTDAMPSVGLPEGRKGFELQTRAITVEGGRCIDANGTLAGSDLDMASAVRNIVEMAGASIPEAATMASTAPAAFLGMSDEIGLLAVGHRADFAMMDAALRPRGTWIAGASVATHR